MIAVENDYVVKHVKVRIPLFKFFSRALRQHKAIFLPYVIQQILHNNLPKMWLVNYCDVDLAKQI